MYVGKDLLYYRKRFVHFWGKMLCILEIILRIFLAENFCIRGNILHFRKDLVYYQRKLFRTSEKYLV